MRNGTCRSKSPPIGDCHRCHAAVAHPILAAPSGRTRAKARRWSIKNRLGEATGVSEVGRIGQGGRRTSPPRSEASNEGRVRHAEAEFWVRVCTLSPGQAEGPKALCCRAGRKPCGLNREPASTGTRSRVFEKQTSDEHIFHRDLSCGVLQGIT